MVDQIGVNGFRVLETQILAEIATRKRLAVACGGGIIFREKIGSIFAKITLLSFGLIYL
ncbi:MAG: hypothetical protein HC768_23375 [Acaryochloris sp. CRU_2_0]|nr:hypothetical protein [Acaryochloris sp. CRU_2_0]